MGAKADLADIRFANHERFLGCFAKSCDSSPAATLAHARCAGHRPREPVLRLGPRSSHRDSACVSRKLGRTGIRARRDRRSLGRAFQLRKIGGRMDRGPPQAAQANRHHRLFRHRAFHFRVRLRAILAGDSADARARMDGARQPRPIARHAVWPIALRQNSKAAHLDLNAPWIRSARCSARCVRRHCWARWALAEYLRWTLLPGLAAGLAFALLAPKGIPDARPSRSELCVQFRATSKNLLALPRRSFRARHRRFCANAADPARGADSDSTFRICARFGHRSGALYFL